MNNSIEGLIDTVRSIAVDNNISPDLLESIIRTQFKNQEDPATAKREISGLLEDYFNQQEATKHDEI